MMMMWRWFSTWWRSSSSTLNARPKSMHLKTPCVKRALKFVYQNDFWVKLFQLLDLTSSWDQRTLAGFRSACTSPAWRWRCGQILRRLPLEALLLLQKLQQGNFVRFLLSTIFYQETLWRVWRATRRSLPNLFVAQGDRPRRPFL